MPTDTLKSTFRVDQLIASEQESIPALSQTTRSVDRFSYTKKLIDRFTQKLLGFLHEIHDPALTDWLIKDEKGRWHVGQLKKNERTYPPHIIAFLDLVRFLTAISENLDLLNSAVTASRDGLVGILPFTLAQSLFFADDRDIFKKIFTHSKKLKALFDSSKKLQDSISAIKKLPIHNGIIDGALYLYEQISKYSLGEPDDLTTAIRVLKDAIASSELLTLKQNYKSVNKELKKDKITVRSQLELDYWKILLATSDAQRKASLAHVKTLPATTENEKAWLDKIERFAKSPAWDVQRLGFLAEIQGSVLPVTRVSSNGNTKPLELSSEKAALYALQLNAIIDRIIEVVPEFAVEDNDAGSMFRTIGTLFRFPIGTIEAVDQAWFRDVMTWLGKNYDELCKDEKLKALAENIYNVHTNFLSDLDELETQLGLKFGLLTHDLPQKLQTIKPTWLTLSADKAGPTETKLRAQSDVWKKYVEKQAYFRVQQRIDRRTYQSHLLEKANMTMHGLLESHFLTILIQPPQTLTTETLETLKIKLLEAEKEIPTLSSMGKYISKKLQEIETEIQSTRFYQGYYLGFTVLATRSVFYQTTNYVRSSARQKEILEKAIGDTEIELQAALTREDAHLKLAWRDYQVNTLAADIKDKEGEKTVIEKCLKEIESAKEKLKSHSLEDTRAQAASEAQGKALEALIGKSPKIILALENSRKTLEAEKARAFEKLNKRIAENTAAIHRAEHVLNAGQDALSLLSQMRTETDSTAKEAQAVPMAQEVDINADEQLITHIDSFIKSLAAHISNKQLYAEEHVDDQAFAIRQCDARWILQLKQVHNLLLELKQALLATQTLRLKSYAGTTIAYVQLTDQLLKLFYKTGDILTEINTLGLYIEDNWFSVLKNLVSSFKAFTHDLEVPASDQEAQINLGAINAPLEHDLPLSQKIKEDISELLIALPSNLPERAQLDADLNIVFKAIDTILGGEKTTIASNGKKLYENEAFKRLIDTFSKLGAFIGSDIILDKLSNYRALLTKHLSEALQRVLSEEIRMGYRAGVLTESLYQIAAALADSELTDLPSLYSEQLSHLNTLNLSDGIEKHFADYIESLLSEYVTKQANAWEKTQATLNQELAQINDQLKVLNPTFSLFSTKGKDEAAKQQGLELKKSQIYRLIITKKRTLTFLQTYQSASLVSGESADATVALMAKTIAEKRKALVKKHSRQESALIRIIRIAPLLTAVKWDLYHYQREVYDKNTIGINALNKNIETYIRLLAEGKNVKELEDFLAEKNLDQYQSLPPAIIRLYKLAHEEIKKDLLVQEQTGHEPSMLFEAPGEDSVVEPSPALQKKIIEYAYTQAKALDIKEDSHQRNIIEQLEIFAEMWSLEKKDDKQIVNRRREILAALQSKDAPDYQYLTHPADVKLVYLLTAEGEYGLAFHKTLFSKQNIRHENAALERVPPITNLPPQIEPHVVEQARSEEAAGHTATTTDMRRGSTPAGEKTDTETVSLADIKMAFKTYFNKEMRSTSTSPKTLSEDGTTYLYNTVEKYEKEPADSNGQKKLRAIYNALLSNNLTALDEAAKMQTGWTAPKPVSLFAERRLGAPEEAVNLNSDAQVPKL